ncbi:Tic22-like family [Musa troglodytarum]|uniref:Tic22-like family n=1 Tax=Musa troglodytarum TaxID=320322 RepID=A0A9E7EBB8_9LILI|nr:Tic22-like family [Musa troglodytarum]
MAFPFLKPRNQNPPPSIPAKPNPFLLTIQSYLNAFSDASSSVKAHLDSAVETLGNRVRRAVLSGPNHLPSPPPTPWARISPAGCSGVRRFDLAMSTEAIEERLAGVPVYALSNAAEEFVLVSGVRTGKSLGLFCFKKEDAEALLEQMRSMNRDMREGSKVVAVALNKVFQLKVDGVAFRFVPDSSQVANAIKVRAHKILIVILDLINLVL